MSRLHTLWSMATALSLACSVLAQPAPAPMEVAKATGIAAVVNGQAIPEAAVRRGLERLSLDRQTEARPELLNYLIENVLIDQFLIQSGNKVEAADIDRKLTEMKDMVKKEQNREFDKFLTEMKVTEAELREHIAADIRWDRYCIAQMNDKLLQELFSSNKEMFDGSLVRARHILMSVPANDPKAAAAAIEQLKAIKAQIEATATAGLAKLPADASAEARARERFKLIDEAFAAAAKEKSGCPSKKEGGDVNFFPRLGPMVEPFAKAAYALKPGDMSDVVQTQFGYHLIFITDRKPGVEKKFEEVKGDVQDVFCDRLHDSLVATVKPKAKIEIMPAPATPTPMK
jgi:peptidyl-prolyl cis-trans isomerase C